MGMPARMSEHLLPPGNRAPVRLLAGLEALDPLAKTLGKTARNVLKPGPVKDALSGTWLGHALHPLLTDVPVGTWTSATLLDLFGGKGSRAASQRLIGVGLLAAGPTFWTGWSDWADTEPADDQIRRIGIVHAITNGSAAALYGASLVARRRRAHAA